jgi:hypothetical protein
MQTSETANEIFKFVNTSLLRFQEQYFNYIASFLILFLAILVIVNPLNVSMNFNSTIAKGYLSIYITLSVIFFLWMITLFNCFGFKYLIVMLKTLTLCSSCNQLEISKSYILGEVSGIIFDGFSHLIIMIPYYLLGILILVNFLFVLGFYIRFQNGKIFAWPMIIGFFSTLIFFGRVFYFYEQSLPLHPLRYFNLKEYPSMIIEFILGIISFIYTFYLLKIESQRES